MRRHSTNKPISKRMPSALFVAVPAILFGSGAQANVAAAEVIDSTGKAVTKTVEVRGRSL